MQQLNFFCFFFVSFLVGSTAKITRERSPKLRKSLRTIFGRPEEACFGVEISSWFQKSQVSTSSKSTPRGELRSWWLSSGRYHYTPAPAAPHKNDWVQRIKKNAKEHWRTKRPDPQKPDRNAREFFQGKVFKGHLKYSFQNKQFCAILNDFFVLRFSSIGSGQETLFPNFVLLSSDLVKLKSMHAATLECKIFSNQHLLFDSVLQLLEKIQVSVSEIKDSIATCPVASNFGGHLNPLLEHDPENLVRNPSL